MAFVLHPNGSNPIMPSRFVRIIAVALIVLGVSPSTASFSTCDWRSWTDHRQSDRAAGDHNAPGASIEAPSDPDEAPVLSVTAGFTTPLFSAVADDATIPAPRVSSQRTDLQGLRI
jgi:hypothetical protein